MYVRLPNPFLHVCGPRGILSFQGPALQQLAQCWTNKRPSLSLSACDLRSFCSLGKLAVNGKSPSRGGSLRMNPFCGEKQETLVVCTDLPWPFPILSSACRSRSPQYPPPRRTSLTSVSPPPVEPLSASAGNPEQAETQDFQSVKGGLEKNFPR